MTPIVILAGGKSMRMGTDKTRLLLGGETLLQRAVRRFSEAFENVIISANGDTGISGVRVLPDIKTGLGPISGLHAALSELDSVFLVAADMPFADPEWAKKIINAADGHDACTATLNGRTEPLFAFYTSRILPLAENAIDAGDYRLHRLLNSVDTVQIPVDARILVNINRPEDYEKIKSSIELDNI